MTLEKAIDYICTLCHRPDDESRNEARQYIQARHRILYNSRLWRDAVDFHTLRGARILNEFGQPLVDENGNIIYSGMTGQVMIMPALIGKVVMLRWGTMEAMVATLQVEEPSTILKVDAERLQRVSDPISFSIMNPSGTATASGGRSLVLWSSSNDASYEVSIRGQRDDQDYDEEVTIAGQARIPSAYSYDQIFSIAKTSNTKDLYVNDDLGTPLLILPRSETSRSHQRIHLHSTPQNSGSLLILYKKRLVELSNDSTEIWPPSMVDMVIEGAVSKMYEGARQHNKAAAKAQEVMALMDVALREEREQSASNPCLIPYDLGGFGLWDEGESKSHF
jgi:hypothetical protein